MVIVLGLDGQFDTKTTVQDECPDMNALVEHLEMMKESKAIKDFGAVCIPANLKNK
jgi:flagellar basal body P-ring protein FlgI